MADVSSDGRNLGAGAERSGAGPSMAVAIAAALAAVLVIIALAAFTGPAGASPREAQVAVGSDAGPARADVAERSGTQAVRGRDAVFVVASSRSAEERRNVDFLVVGTLFLAMTAATTVAWRMLGRSVGAVASVRPRR